MRKIVFLSLEFSAGTFSGNGIYARSQVRSLCHQQCEILVLSGKPAEHNGPLQSEGAKELIEVELPVWGCLDHRCSWQQLAAQLSVPAVIQRIAAFAPSAILGVDWSSLPAYKAVAAALLAQHLPVPPFIYMNYRVYVRTCDGEDRPFMLSMEQEAASTAITVLALSRSDAQYIEDNLLLPEARCKQVTVLLPALRADMAAAPTSSSLPHPAAARHYLTCCVRLSPEKEPHRFVELVEELAEQGKLALLGITPVLFAAASTAFATALVARIQAAAPNAVVLSSFMGPAELAKVYAQTRLNFHPPLYDAYGMTIVEAASQGAPSVITGGGAVGAADLLQAPHEIIELELATPMPQLAQQV